VIALPRTVLERQQQRNSGILPPAKMGWVLAIPPNWLCLTGLRRGEFRAVARLHPVLAVGHILLVVRPAKTGRKLVTTQDWLHRRQRLWPTPNTSAITTACLKGTAIAILPGLPLTKLGRSILAT